MYYPTSARILLVIQMLYQGATQTTCPTRHFVGEPSECEMEVQKDTEIRCRNEVIHSDCVENFFYYWTVINESNAALQNGSGATAFSLDYILKKRPGQLCRFYVCKDKTGTLKDITHRKFDELLTSSEFQSQCYFSTYCLDGTSEVLAKMSLKSLKIMEIGQIKLQKTSFRAYPNLTVLSLRESDVVLDGDVFHGLWSLRTLTLSGDSITVLPLELFSGLERLTELDVSRNRLGEISEEHFASLRSLVFLDLSHNEIRTLGDDVFSTVPALKVLSLSSNQLQSLPAKIFSETNSLTNVDLSGNGVTELPKELFWNLHNLVILNLSRCGLRSLDEHTFSNSSNLKVLVLSYNELTTLRSRILNTQAKLEVLDVSHNELSNWSDEILQKVFNLRILRLNNNKLASLRTFTFVSTRSLEVLDVSENELRSFHGKLIENVLYLDDLNASGNIISYVEFGLHNAANVRKLNFSRNEITSFDIYWENILYLEIADFDWNNLTSLDLPVCAMDLRRTVFSFRHNSISYVRTQYRAHIRWRKWNCNGQPENTLLLAGNPLNCDCKLYALHKRVTKPGSIIQYRFPDSDTWNCNEPKYLKNSSFASLNEDMFLCPVIDCPEPCFCGVRATDNRTIVNCTSKNLKTVPESAPKNVSILYFRENKLKKLNLKKAIWENLTELYLDNNLLENVEATDIPEGLRVLSLSGNRLQNVSMSLRNFVSLHNYVRLRLGNNSWNCTCSLKSSKEWLLKHKRNVMDPNDINCEIMEKGESRTISLYKIPDKLLCPELLRAVRIATVVGIVTSGVLVIVGLVLLLVYYKHAETVHAFLYGTSLFQCFFREDPEEEEEKIFDAFVAYSSKDTEVTMKLVEQLEGESPYFRLCIHERDWIAGQFVSENIVSSVQSSRRVILVLSEDFVSSVWFAVEVRAVLFQMLQDRVNRLLVVVVGSFPSLDGIENDIRQLLLRRTYLVWGERWFWEKIRYALPHKGQRAPRTKTRGRKFRLVSLVEKEVSGAVNQETRTEANA